MLEKSKKEGDAERVLYAKFKCYCDQSEAEKKASIEKLTEQIDLLESNIAEVQGSTGGLSSECADLKTQMADNKAARDEADTIRGKEKKAFEAEEADLTQAIKQMKNAIEVLSAVGADQTQSTGADNKQFMAKGASLLDLHSQVQSALRLASVLMNPAQQSKTAAFLQAPFTGTYTSQSAQVLGIIKSMRDTFKANLLMPSKPKKMQRLHTTSSWTSKRRPSKTWQHPTRKSKRPWVVTMRILPPRRSSSLNLRSKRLQMRNFLRSFCLCARPRPSSIKNAICFAQMRKPPSHRPSAF